MGKVRIEEQIEIDVAPEQAWELLGDFGANHRWMPAVVDTKMEGQGIGATRRLTMPDGGYVDEREVERDDGARSYRYEMYGGTLPVKDYESRISVSALGSGCQVHWLAEFEAVPDAPIDSAAFVREVYQSGLTSAKRLLEGD